MSENDRSLSQLFLNHKVAANLLMMIIIVVGIFSLQSLNTQFLPQVHLNFVTISVPWRGASAEDVERSITRPLELELRNLNHLKKISSSSRIGSASIQLEFKNEANMSDALDDVKEKVALVRNLPSDIEPPVITRVINFEPVASFVVTGPKDIEQLRPYIHQFKQALLDRGIAKVEVTGLPEQEIAIQVPSHQLNRLRRSLSDIGTRVNQLSQDAPSGTFAHDNSARQLRSLNQSRSIKAFQDIKLLANQQGQLIKLGDIATIEKRAKRNEVSVFHDGNPAVDITIYRTPGASVLKAATIMHEWIKDTEKKLPKGIKIQTYDENWQYIKQRTNLLMKNGSGGLLLIIILLMLFLEKKVAFWIAIGIPISFMGTLAVLHAVGGSINMISLFAMIMSLGIIVDDTIVVGEEAMTQLQLGKDPKTAVSIAVRRMLRPVFASSLTTICAFLPLILVTGTIGDILRTIPIVVISVIISSLLECFLILPRHLYESFKRNKIQRAKGIRRIVTAGFEIFKEHYFRPFVHLAIQNKGATLATAISIFIMAIGLIIGGFVNFTFFKAPEGGQLFANVEFAAGSSKTQVTAFLDEVNRTLKQTEQAFIDEGHEPLIMTSVTFQAKTTANQDAKRGPEYGSLSVELTNPDMRTVTNQAFINAWLANTRVPPGVQSFNIREPARGPRGEDIDILLTGKNAHQLKQAAVAVAQVLSSFSGVYNIKDNLPYGQEQLIFDLTPHARVLGMTTALISQQLRAAFTGNLAQIFHQPNDEIEVRVSLPTREQNDIQTLENFPIKTPSGDMMPLGSLVHLRSQRGFDILQHSDTQLGVHITAQVDNNVSNAGKILAQVTSKHLPAITQKYHVSEKLEGQSEEQAKTLSDMFYGLIIGIILIYFVLTWIFTSYGWPLIVMSAIPLGLTGAIVGHWIMGLDLTIISLFGLFGLAGIVINDSIILISRYQEIRSDFEVITDAITEACVQRLRPVFLTSITTIAGLLPLLFETSFQAKFLIPMAVAITFGLAYATLLILIVIPAILAIYESFSAKRQPDPALVHNTSS